MLRRVLRTLRILLAILGVVLLIWVPASLYLYVSLRAPWPAGGAELRAVEGAVSVIIHRQDDVFVTYTASLERQYYTSVFMDHLWPVVQSWQDIHYVQIPLWLLAAICLAWPVTSYVVQRRRRGRGFAVETGGI